MTGPDRVDLPLRDEPSPAAVRSSELLLTGRIWDVRRDVVELAGGAVVTRDVVTHPGAVAVLAMDDEQRVLLIRQCRHPISALNWELPAGLRDVAGEDPVVTAQRELLEETDLRADTWSHLVTLHPSPGSLDEAIEVYLAQDIREVPAAERHERTDEEAGIVAQWAPITTVVDAIVRGDLHNGPLVAAILVQHARLSAGAADDRPAARHHPT